MRCVAVGDALVECQNLLAEGEDVRCQFGIDDVISYGFEYDQKDLAGCILGCLQFSVKCAQVLSGKRVDIDLKDQGIVRCGSEFQIQRQVFLFASDESLRLEMDAEELLGNDQEHQDQRRARPLNPGYGEAEVSADCCADPRNDERPGQENHQGHLEEDQFTGFQLGEGQVAIEVFDAADKEHLNTMNDVHSVESVQHGISEIGPCTDQHEAPYQGCRSNAPVDQRDSQGEKTTRKKEEL